MSLHSTRLVRNPDSTADSRRSRRVRIGRGRSGVVYRQPHGGGIARAVKVFVGDPAGDLVHVILRGAPNPYRWNRDAILAAMHRRRVVADLVRVWFGDRLRVALPRKVAWNARARAWELHADLVDGRPAALHQPFSGPRDGEGRELVREIMRPLQRRLRRAGLDGLVWQAGLGNPVAMDNFLRDAEVPGRWHWIDLESGVPAVAAVSPRAVLGFYAPRTLALRRPLFDDIDVPRLRAYLQERRDRFVAVLGEAGWSRLHDEIDALEGHQRAWHRPHRLERAITAAVILGRLDPDEASYYRSRPWLWLARELRGGVVAAGAAVRRWTRSLARLLGSLRPAAMARDAMRFVTSRRYRQRVGRSWVLGRIRQWSRRRQLTPAEARFLRDQARDQEDGTYLADFAVHLAIKPVYKPLAWLLAPAMAQLGWIDVAWVPVILLFSGAAARSLYTLPRILDALARRRPAPWLALGWGCLPVVGTAAFPLQILVRGAEDGGDRLAALLVYDVATAVGRRLPIWGGQDSFTEHLTNRLGDLAVWRRPAMQPVGGTAGAEADVPRVERMHA